MQQAIIKKGKVTSESLPIPMVESGRILIKVAYSCISSGTEMSSVKESGISLTQRLLEKPGKIKEGIKMVTDNGIKKTIAILKGITEGGSQTGYSASGVVVATGSDIVDFKPGDLVAAAGGGLANHAEYISVPVNLVAKVPQNVSLKDSSTIAIGGIAMQGVRRANLNIGEFCVVTGAGVLGLITIQILKAAGIRVAAVDTNSARLELAKDLGAEHTFHPESEDIVKLAETWTNGHGADAVIFTAGTSSNEPLSKAFQMCRKKGKVILVGVSGMQLNRKDIYTKELDFLISTSYGPGRYDDNYELKGQDYPYAYVRWTEKRNMEEYLRLLSSQQVTLSKMIAKDFPISDVTKAYDYINSDDKPVLVLLSYGDINLSDQPFLNSVEKIIHVANPQSSNGKINLAMVGVGNFATNMHLPNIDSLNKKFNLHCVVNRSGIKAKNIAEQYGASYITTDIEDVLKDKIVDLVFISTRHDSHAELVLKALRSGKNVFVEKPLATSLKELEEIEKFYAEDTGSKPLLMTGFNRRFSPLSKEIKKHTNKRINPLFIQYRMNAGFIPLDKWVHENGGRIVGEACHIIDLMTYFTESTIESISYEALSPSTNKFSSSDNVSFILKYTDGSVCNIQYFSNGSKLLPKEYMEIHFDEKSIVMEDFKTLKGFDLKVKDFNSNISLKGQKEELIALHDSLNGIATSWPIELWDMIQTTKATLLLTSK